MRWIINENGDREDVDKNRPEDEQRDVAQARDEQHERADKLEYFYEFHVAAGREDAHELRDGRAFRHWWHFHQVKQHRHTGREETEGEQNGRDGW